MFTYILVNAVGIFVVYLVMFLMKVFLVNKDGNCVRIVLSIMPWPWRSPSYATSDSTKLTKACRKGGDTACSVYHARRL